MFAQILYKRVPLRESDKKTPPAKSWLTFCGRCSRIFTPLPQGSGGSPRVVAPPRLPTRGDFYSSCFRRSYTALIPCRIMSALLCPVLAAQYSNRSISSCDSRTRVLSCFGSSVGLPVRGDIVSPLFRIHISNYILCGHISQEQITRKRVRFEMQPFDIMERARYNLFAPAPGVLQALCLLLWSAVRQGAFFTQCRTGGKWSSG